MKKIMILLFSFAKIEKVIEETKNTLDEQTSEIHLIFYQNKDIPDTLSSLMGVYLGEKIQKDVEHTILREYHRMKDELIQRFNIIAEKKDLKVKEQLFKSYSTDKICQYIEEHDIDYLIVNYFQNKYNSQKVFTDIEEEFFSKLDIKYKLFKHQN